MTGRRSTDRGSAPARTGAPRNGVDGFLAVLFVPALARRRRQRAGSVLPQIAELATGSVALAGVLFILVGAGVEVYSDLTTAFSPGNPAVIPWTAVQPSAAATMSPRVLAPNNAEAVVALNRNLSVSYGNQPYGPGIHTAYDLVWQTVVDLHLGPSDNPLRDLVTDMNGDGIVRVLIKPNTVEYYTPDAEGNRNPVYVHPAMIRPLIDMAARAGANRIYVGDGSDATGAYFTSKMDPMGYTQAYFNQLAALWPGVTIARVDFHNPRRFTWCGLDTQPGGPSAYAGSGYTSSQLQKSREGGASSYFSAADGHGLTGPGSSNCMGWLAISDELLDADVIIDLAKLKVHYLSVNTAVLKNWVGVTMYSTFDASNIGGCRVAHNAYNAGNYEMEFGNDILWREMVDAHRSVLYYRNGTIHAAPQRRYLCIIDHLTRTIRCGTTPPTDTFTVHNAGIGTLNYSVTVDDAAQSWLSAPPTAGTSAGEYDTITVNYNPANLPQGTTVGTITISDPDSVNQRRMIPVTLIVTGYDVDFDNDTDVDQEDYGHFQACLTGSGMPPVDPACGDVPIDDDVDVDQSDLLVFVSCVSGPGIPASLCCRR
ncbi:MAG: DUF362 domain-containing protein [Planctomycetes bacterium]|nr:DUF362 domain-containing protein [Planctomycetota bacterium]